MRDERTVQGRGTGMAEAAAHRAALEALFAPKAPASPSKRDSARMVAAPVARDPEADGAERERLLARLLEAEGRAAITRAADDLERAGLPLPDSQAVHLQVLEHADEARVRSSLIALARILATEAPARRVLLDARLRRVEERADDAETATLASAARRRLAGRA
jgi:hypothetical protein